MKPIIKEIIKEIVVEDQIAEEIEILIIDGIQIVEEDLVKEEVMAIEIGQIRSRMDTKLCIRSLVTASITIIDELDQTEDLIIGMKLDSKEIEQDLKVMVVQIVVQDICDLMKRHTEEFHQMVRHLGKEARAEIEANLVEQIREKEN